MLFPDGRSTKIEKTPPLGAKTMPLKEQLLQAIETLPSERLAEALTFIQSLQAEPSPTSAQSFLAHLKTIGTWSAPDTLNQGEQAIRQVLALQLYAQNIFTFGQARRLADLSVWEFQQLLAQHNIQRHYSEIELAEDADAIETGTWQT
jgi:predicted HTH domain antitoxin